MIPKSWCFSLALKCISLKNKSCLLFLWQVNNPATGDLIASVACMGEKETKDAISSAYEAFGRTRS